MDVAELSEVVDADSEPDVWVLESDDGVEIGSGVRAICIAFPFTLAEFWETVDEVEDEAVRLIEGD